MKGSSVVLGFKSWAAKLHPPFPLENKESNRLLASLKSSFRKQLDDAHPWPVNDGSKATHAPRAPPAFIRPKQQQWTSPASLADAHLAEVLSSPLMTKSASRQEPSHDLAKGTSPIHVISALILQLEHADSQGLAALAVARRCLQKSWDLLRPLSPDARVSAIMETRPASRALHWLSSKGLHQSEEILKDQRLLVILVQLLDREGRDDLVWSWMEFSPKATQSPDHTSVHLAGSDSPTPLNVVPLPFTLQGFLLKFLINSKLDAEHPSTESTNVAMDTFFRACELSQTARWQALGLGSLSRAGQMLTGVLKKKSHTMPPLDAQRFDRFLASVSIFVKNENKLRPQYFRSILWIYHPVSPDPYPALNMLKTIFNDDRSAYARRLALAYEAPEDVKKSAKLFEELLDLAKLLHAKRDFEHAAWVIEKAKQYFPSLAELTDLKKFELPKVNKPKTSPPASERDPYQAGIWPPAFG